MARSKSALAQFRECSSACDYLAGAVGHGLDRVGMRLAHLDLARDEAGQRGAHGLRRAGAQRVHLLVVLVLLLVTVHVGHGVRDHERRAGQSQVP